jgi:transposase
MLNENIIENLNIHDHHKILAIKALDCSKTVKEAANKIGITDRTLYRWIKIFNIDFDENKYVIKKTNNL